MQVQFPAQDQGVKETRFCAPRNMDCQRFSRLSSPGTGDGRMPPIIVDDVGYDKSHFLIPKHYLDSVDRVLLPQGVILDRIEKLAYDIMEFYKDEEVNIICILKGSRGFFNQLTHFFNKLSTYGSPRKGPLYLEHYVRIKTYQNSESSGTFNVIAEDLTGLKGKHVLIVEDIIDTGHTLSRFCRWLEEHIQPRDIAVTSLLEKRTPATNGFKGDFVGFSVPDAFVVGFSLDYNELFRDLDHICVLDRAAIEAFAKPRS